MPLTLIANIDQLIFTDAVPDNLKNHIIQAVPCKIATLSCGHILSQETTTDHLHFGVQHRHYSFTEDTRLRFEHARPVVELFFNLGAPLQCHLSGSGNMTFNRGTFNILYAPSVKTELYFQKREIFRTLSILIPPDFMASMVRFFPVFTSLVKKAERQQPGFLFRTNIKASGEVMNKIHEIMVWPFDGIPFNAYIEVKVMEMLKACFQTAASAPRAVTVHLSEAEKTLIEEIKKEITKNLSKPIVLSELAARFGISEDILKKLFNKLNQKTIYKYQLEVRLEKAKEMLLITELTVEQIGIQIGYENGLSFSKAFKKQFKVSPANFRKRERGMGSVA